MEKYLLKIKLTFSGIMLCILMMQCKKETIPVPDSDLNLIINKINLLRQSGCNCGSDYMPPVPNLTLNIFLQQAALVHAKDMAQRNYFDHLSPEGTSPNERASSAGYTGVFISENLARGYTNADQVVAAWKTSVSHCKAMMDATSSEAGGGETQNYWVVTFGKP